MGGSLGEREILSPVPNAGSTLKTNGNKVMLEYMNDQPWTS